MPIEGRSHSGTEKYKRGKKLRGVWMLSRFAFVSVFCFLFFTQVFF